MQKLKNLIQENYLDEKELLLELKKIITQNEFGDHLDKASVGLSELLQNKIQLLEQDHDAHQSIKTGFAELDKLLGGISPGELIVIGGRPGMGKTTLLANMALNIAPTSNVLYFSFDLSCYSLINRYIAITAGIPTNRLERNDIKEDEKNLLKNVQQNLNGLSLFIREDGNISLSLFKAICEKEIAEKKIKVIVIDYLQMMKTHRFKNNRDLEISMIMRELKTIAKEQNVCILISSQLSRSVETRGGDKRPYLSDLRESGSIEQDADKVIFVYRPEYYGLIEDEFGMPTDGIMELIVAKNRTGMLDTVKFNFERETGKINEAVPAGDFNFHFSQDRLNELNEDKNAPF